MRVHCDVEISDDVAAYALCDVANSWCRQVPEFGTLTNILFKSFLHDIIGDTYVEKLYFHPVFLRYHGGYAGVSRVTTVVETYEPYCGPGQSLVPAIEFDIGQLTCEEYIHLMGTFSN